MIDDYSGLQKAAILLITLGPEKASAIFQHLKEDEIESLTLEIANTRSVSPQDKESVLDEYYQVCLAQQYIAEGGIGYAKELLEKALGSEKAQGVISKLTASLQVRPFEFVRKTEPAQLLNFIQDEHPQTIAMILSYIDISGIIKTQPASAAPASKAGATATTGTAAAVSVKASDAAFGTPAGSSANADVINHTHEILKLYKSGKSNVEIAKLLSLGTGEVKLIIDLYKEGK